MAAQAAGLMPLDFLERRVWPSLWCRLLACGGLLTRLALG